MVLIYFIVAFVVFFITYKLRIGKFREEGNGGGYARGAWVERQTFWVLLFVPVFWMISIPAIVAWVVLDKIYNKLTNKNNN